MWDSKIKFNVIPYSQKLKKKKTVKVTIRVETKIPPKKKCY